MAILGIFFNSFQGIFLGGNYFFLFLGIFPAGAQPNPWEWQAWKKKTNHGNISKKMIPNSQISRPQFTTWNKPTPPALPKRFPLEYPPLIPEKPLGKSPIFHPKSQEFQEMPGIPWGIPENLYFSYLVGGKKPGNALGMYRSRGKNPSGSDSAFPGKPPAVRIQRLRGIFGNVGPGRGTFGVFVCLALRNFNKSF